MPTSARNYNLEVELMLGAQPQVSRVFTLLPEEKNSLKKTINNILAHSTIYRTMLPWATPVLFTGRKDGYL